jgi:hypothetical protein
LRLFAKQDPDFLPSDFDAPDTAVYRPLRDFISSPELFANAASGSRVVQ